MVDSGGGVICCLVWGSSPPQRWSRYIYDHADDDDDQFGCSRALLCSRDRESRGGEETQKVKNAKQECVL